MDRRSENGCCVDGEIKLVNLHGHMNQNVYIVPKGVTIVTLVVPGMDCASNLTWIKYFEDLFMNRGIGGLLDVNGKLTREGREIQRKIQAESDKWWGKAVNFSHVIVAHREGDVMNNTEIGWNGRDCTSEVVELPNGGIAAHTPNMVARLLNTYGEKEGKKREGWTDASFKNIEGQDVKYQYRRTPRKNCGITCIKDGRITQFTCDHRMDNATPSPIVLGTQVKLCGFNDAINGPHR